MAVWSCKRSGWVTILTTLLLSTSLILSILTFFLDQNTHSTFVLYLSYGGGNYYENGAFSLLLYFSSVLGIVTLTVRYVFVDDLNRDRKGAADSTNKISVAFGFLSLFGMALIASYPLQIKAEENNEISSQHLPHTIGVHILFISATCYMILQTVLSFIITRTTPITIIRLMLSTIALSSLIVSITILNVESGLHRSGVIFCQPEIHGQDLIIFIFERIFIFTYTIFFLSYIREFQKISIYLIVRPLLLQTTTDNRNSWTISQRF